MKQLFILSMSYLSQVHLHIYSKETAPVWYGSFLHIMVCVLYVYIEPPPLNHLFRQSEYDPGGLFFLHWQCVSLICVTAAPWVDTTHTRREPTAGQIPADPMIRRKFPLLQSEMGGENYTPDFARCEVNNVLFMGRLEPRVRTHRSGRTGAGWLEVCRERRKRMGERFVGKR